MRDDAGGGAREEELEAGPRPRYSAYMTIVLDSLRVVSAGHVLVDDVNLIVEPASRTALVGASGAGKSLTCKALAGILPPDLSVTGSLTVSSVPGRDLLPLPAPQRPGDTRIALVAQDSATALHPLIPIDRQVRAAARASGDDPREARVRATDLLFAVGLDSDSLHGRVPGRLSGGQRQRAALALALACRPALLIADEPTTALDVVARAEILALLTDLTAIPHAPALLLITHDLPAAATCEQVVVLSAGRVIETGPAAVVLSAPQHPVTRAMCRAAREETLAGARAAMKAAA